MSKVTLFYYSDDDYRFERDIETDIVFNLGIQLEVYIKGKSIRFWISSILYDIDEELIHVALKDPEEIEY